MINNKLLNVISDAVAADTISTAMTIEKESTEFHVLESNDRYIFKDEFLKDKGTKGLKNTEDKIISIDNYKALLRERIVNDENELLWLLKNTQIKNIKLATNLDLSKFKAEDLIIKIDDLTINGNGNTLTLAEHADYTTPNLLILKGNGITLKNTNIKIESNKLKARPLDIISIFGNNTKLVNVSINANGNSGIKVSNCFGVELNKIYIKGSKCKNSAIRVESAEVLCKNIKIKSFSTGLESVGRTASLTIQGKQYIDTQFHIKNNFKSGSMIKAVENKLNLLEKVFCYEYFKLGLQ